jgi:hypothetical protein
MDKLMERYRAKFGEQFPLMMFLGADDAEIAKIITQSIENNIPYEPDPEDDNIY